MHHFGKQRARHWRMRHGQGKFQWHEGVKVFLKQLEEQTGTEEDCSSREYYVNTALLLLEGARCRERYRLIIKLCFLL